MHDRVRAGRYPGYFPCSHLGTVIDIIRRRRRSIAYLIKFDKSIPFENSPRHEEVVSGTHRGHKCVYAVEEEEAVHETESTISFLGLDQQESGSDGNDNEQKQQDSDSNGNDTEEDQVSEPPSPQQNIPTEASAVAVRRKRVYLCRICGQPKRGHVCTGGATTNPDQTDHGPPDHTNADSRQPRPNRRRRRRRRNNDNNNVAVAPVEEGVVQCTSCLMQFKHPRAASERHDRHHPSCSFFDRSNSLSDTDM